MAKKRIKVPMIFWLMAGCLSAAPAHVGWALACGAGPAAQIATAALFGGAVFACFVQLFREPL